MYISTVHAHVHVLLHGSRKVTSVRDIAEAKKNFPHQPHVTQTLPLLPSSLYTSILAKRKVLPGIEPGLPERYVLSDARSESGVITATLQNRC
jgi:hypothetical protein